MPLSGRFLVNQVEGDVAHPAIRRHHFDPPGSDGTGRVERRGADGGVAAEHSGCHRRRLVVPPCRGVRRSDRFNACVRSDRPRRRDLHERVHSGAVVHPVACRAPHRAGYPSPCRRGQPPRISARALCGVSRPARSGRLSRRVHGKGLGPRSVPARRPLAQSGRAAVQAVRRVPGEAPSRSALCVLVRQHRSPPAIRAGSGAKSGLRADTVAVPAFFPDTPDVRSDLLDYLFEVQRFDSQVARLVETLEKAGELDNTIVVVTSDNGMPFPRAKANLYDAGTHMPWRCDGRGRSRAARRFSRSSATPTSRRRFSRQPACPVQAG